MPVLCFSVNILEITICNYDWNTLHHLHCFFRSAKLTKRLLPFQVVMVSYYHSVDIDVDIILYFVFNYLTSIFVCSL